jgi:histidyl-tRNA synthetase
MLKQLLEFKGNDLEKIEFLQKTIGGTDSGKTGTEEMSFILNQLKELGLSSSIEFDLTLARGLNYYTGAIFEVVTKDVKIGSICGGGRYDDLTGIFGLPGVSGVGVSFGADRIYDVMLELNLFPAETSATTQVLFVNFGEKEQKYCLPLVSRLRSAGINAELFPDQAKMKKQMSYANSKNIPFVVLVGENEMNSGSLTVKDMSSGEQVQTTLDLLIMKIADKT